MLSTDGSVVVRRRRQFDTVPIGSASSTQTLCPASMAATASPTASVLLPVPPLRETIAIVCMARLPCSLDVATYAMAHNKRYATATNATLQSANQQQAAHFSQHGRR